MATNRFPGTCKTCGTQVPAEAGELRKEQGAWVVYHPACLPAAGPGWPVRQRSAGDEAAAGVGAADLPNAPGGLF